MNGLLSCTPSPLAVRLAVAAILLLLVHIVFVLAAPAVAAGLKLVGWIVGLVAAACLGFALFGRWPRTTRVWKDHHDA